MSYEWRYRPIIPEIALLQCPGCGRVSEDATYELYDSNRPMPCCGTTTGPRQWWPDRATRSFLWVVKNRDTLVDQGEQVRFVFLAALLEALLEEPLFQLLAAKHGRQQAEKTLSKVHGAATRRGLFDRESDKKLRIVLSEHGHADFLKKWDHIVRLRNRFAHGRSVIIAKADQHVAEAIEASAVRAFAAVHNDVVRQCEKRRRRLTRRLS